MNVYRVFTKDTFTYIFVHKNGSAALTLSAEDSHDAHLELEKLVSDPEEWRFDEKYEGTLLSP